MNVSYVYPNQVNRSYQQMPPLHYAPGGYSYMRAQPHGLAPAPQLRYNASVQQVPQVVPQ